MADKKVPALTALGATPDGSDLLYIVDVSDATDDATGTSKKVTVTELVGVEVNDLTASVTWANVPSANITEAAVTQHEAALTVTESQISDLGSYLTANQTVTLSGDVTGSGATSITATIAAGAVDIAMLSATGTPSASTYLRGDNTWAGGSAYLVHTYVVDETSLVDTNSPAARRFFLNTHRYVMLFDLSNFTQCRLVVNKQGVAGAAAYQLSVEYRAAGFSTSVANYVDIGTSAVSCACNVTNTIVDSGWINLAAGAIADSVAVCVTSEGGDGVLDPQFGSVVIQFK